MSTINLDAGTNTADQVTVLTTNSSDWLNLAINMQSGSQVVNVGNGTFNGFAQDAVVSVNGGNLKLNDSSSTGADSYTVTNSSVYRLESGSIPDWTVNYTGVSQLSLKTSAGTGDTVNVNSTASTDTTSVTTTGSGETVNVGSSTSPLSNIAGALSITGLSGDSTTLNVNDGDSTTTTTYTVQSNSIASNHSATISYLNIHTLGLTASTGSGDVINVQSTASGTTTTVFARTGITFPQINVGNSSNNLSGIQGVLILDGNQGAGSGIVTLNDADNPAATNYSVTSGSLGLEFQGGSPAPIYTNWSYGGVFGPALPSSIILDAGSNSSDQVTVLTTNSSDWLTLAVNMQNASQVVNVGNGTFNGFSQDAFVSVNGGILNLDDSLSTGSDSYTVTNNSVYRLESGSIPDWTVDYTGISQLNLKTSDGTADTVNVLSTASGVPTSITTTGSVATVNVGNSSNPLTNLAGALSVNGLAGDSTTLNVDDADDSTAAATYTMTTGAVGLTSNPINIANIRTLTLVSGTDSGDSVAIDSTAAGTTNTVTLGGSSQTINVGAGSGNQLSGILGR